MLINKKGETISVDLNRFTDNKPSLIASAVLYAQPCGLNSEEVRLHLESLSTEQAIIAYENYFSGHVNIIK